VKGELCVSGDGLARGYMNNKELTSQKFIPHPFLEGERLYRTGDLARRLPNGNLEYLGRIDDQVKIRGFRIEPGEIEQVLLERPEIKSAAIKVYERDNTNFLCAYYITHTDDLSISTTDFRAFLLQYLPGYMIPAFFVKMRTFPLNNSGKIAKEQLPEPDYQRKKENQFIAPKTEIQLKIAEIWKQVLEIP
ncbi:MAG: amino acid adenylation domain-containing protein, partial [bacterium]|nr:amino acid adenylation domain-containing protein [bacterium]